MTNSNFITYFEDNVEVKVDKKGNKRKILTLKYVVDGKYIPAGEFKNVK